jgi:hypothetical protein
MRTFKEFKKEITPVEKLEVKLVNKIQEFQSCVETFGEHMYKLVPDSEHRSVAARKLMELKHACVQAITHHSRN